MDGSRSHFLRVQGVSKSYSQGGVATPVLDGVDLSLGRGESLALLGVSGTGKSTLLNILGGIELPDAGHVMLGDSVIDATPEAASDHRRRNVGFVFQFYNLLPSLTAMENVLVGLDAMGPLPADAHARAHAALMAVGMADRGAAFPAQLSGGQQQRIAIARAIVKRAPLILADEPTGNLDPHTGEQVLAVLLQQCREVGSALVIVTHNEHIARRTGKAVVMSDGRVQPWVVA